jgi:hypothetical protein
MRRDRQNNRAQQKRDDAKGRAQRNREEQQKRAKEKREERMRRRTQLVRIGNRLVRVYKITATDDDKEDGPQVVDSKEAEKRRMESRKRAKDRGDLSREAARRGMTVPELNAEREARQADIDERKKGNLDIVDTTAEDAAAKETPLGIIAAKGIPAPMDTREAVKERLASNNILAKPQPARMVPARPAHALGAMQSSLRAWDEAIDTLFA